MEFRKIPILQNTAFFMQTALPAHKTLLFSYRLKNLQVHTIENNDIWWLRYNKTSHAFVRTNLGKLKREGTVFINFVKIQYGVIYKFTFITSPFGLSIKKLIYISFYYITTFLVSWENQRSLHRVSRRLLRLCFVYYFVNYCTEPELILWVSKYLLSVI